MDPFYFIRAFNALWRFWARILGNRFLIWGLGASSALVVLLIAFKV